MSEDDPIAALRASERTGSPIRTIGPPEALAGAQITVDLVIATCDACDLERRFPVHPPMPGGPEGRALVAWLEANLTPCPCRGGRTAEIKMRIVLPS